MTPAQYALFRWYCVFGLHRWETLEDFKQKTTSGGLHAVHYLQRCQCCGAHRTTRAVFKRA